MNQEETKLVITYFFANYYGVYMSKNDEEKQIICNFLNRFLSENNLNYDNSLVNFFSSKNELYQEIKLLLIEQNYILKKDNFNTFYIFSINKILFKINKINQINSIKKMLKDYIFEDNYFSYNNKLDYDIYCKLVFELNHFLVRYMKQTITKSKVYKVTKKLKEKFTK
jgi:hypothetical protein